MPLLYLLTAPSFSFLWAFTLAVLPTGCPSHLPSRNSLHNQMHEFLEGADISSTHIPNAQHNAWLLAGMQQVFVE